MTPSTGLRDSLFAIYRSRSSPAVLPLTTPRILRSRLRQTSSRFEWDDQEWKDSRRGQVLALWEQILVSEMMESQHETISGAHESIASTSKRVESLPRSDPRHSTSKDQKGRNRPNLEEEVILLSSSQLDPSPRRSAHEQVEEGTTGQGESATEAIGGSRKRRKTDTTSHTKYDRAAERNFESFSSMALGGAIAEFSGDDGTRAVEDSARENGRLCYEEDCSTAEGSPPPVTVRQTSHTNEARRRAAKGLRKVRTSTKFTSKTAAKGSTIYKSTEFVHESDDSSNEVLPPPPKNVVDTQSLGNARGKGKAKAVICHSEEDNRSGDDSSLSGMIPLRDEKKTKKKKDNVKGAKRRTKGEREAVRREGDAEKGTEAEESRIAYLKNLLKLAGTPRPFTAQTGAERTLSVAQRFELLSSLLNELGLNVTGNDGRGKLPTESRAKEIGSRRELERETEALRGTCMKHTGLRTGKKRQSRPSDSSDDSQPQRDRGVAIDEWETHFGGRNRQESAEGIPKRTKLAERKNFASFLGDQSDSEGC